MQKIIIAIDGHSSCGKSTLAKDLAKELNYAYIDSGAMYRAVTLYLIEHNVNVSDEAAIVQMLPNIQIRFKRDEYGNNITLLNGENVEEAIRGMAVSSQVSMVAAISPVRKKLVEEQRAMGRQKGIIMDGRDIGTVVFPEAELKIFLTAHTEIRANRRHLELQQKGTNISLEAVKNNLLERDSIDSSREDSPLRKAEDALLLDNSFLNREEQVKQVLTWMKERI